MVQWAHHTANRRTVSSHSSTYPHTTRSCRCGWMGWVRSARRGSWMPAPVGMAVDQDVWIDIQVHALIEQDDIPVQNRWGPFSGNVAALGRPRNRLQQVFHYLGLCRWIRIITPTLDLTLTTDYRCHPSTSRVPTHLHCGAAPAPHVSALTGRQLQRPSAIRAGQLFVAGQHLPIPARRGWAQQRALWTRPPTLGVDAVADRRRAWRCSAAARASSAAQHHLASRAQRNVCRLAATSYTASSRRVPLHAIAQLGRAAACQCSLTGSSPLAGALPCMARVLPRHLRLRHSPSGQTY